LISTDLEPSTSTVGIPLSLGAQRQTFRARWLVGFGARVRPPTGGRGLVTAQWLAGLWFHWVVRDRILPMDTQITI